MSNLNIAFEKFGLAETKKMIFVFSAPRHFSQLISHCRERHPESFKSFERRQFQYMNFIFHFVEETDSTRGMIRSSGREGNFYMFYPFDPGYFFSLKQIREIEEINDGRLKLIKDLKSFQFLLENGKLPEMRTIGEILESAKEGEIPNHEECHWTLLALRSRLAHAEISIMRAEERIKESDPTILPILKNLFCIPKDSASFLEATPKEWLGDLHNPFSEGGKDFREMSKIIVERAIRDQYE